LAPPNWRPGTIAGSLGSAERNGWIDLLVGMINSTQVEWLSTLTALARADNKVVQLAAARTCGVATPRTVVVSHREMLPAELGDRVVVKPLGPGDFVSDEGVGHVVWSTVMDRGNRELDSLVAAPFIVQEIISAAAHLRVVTVHDRVFGGRLSADGLKTDWRRHDEAHHAFEPFAVPPHLAGRALALTRHLKVGYSSQDWIETPAGNFVFLDLNPAGQWLFLPAEVSQPVSQEIAAWLKPQS
jgi:glutathione synthase/RimK-type ligase-like ATP-grasp enzyme